MTSKTIFNMNSTLKKAVMKKAKKEGMTLSDVLNFSARAYIDGDIQVRLVDRDTAEALDDIANGRVISQEALFKKLGL
ncbi:MAG: hypothetical protein KBC33_03600 [Candidatus Pacebacteria bacterium]|nr:hypothetical protein [Candidatus Paceibacterota bacterium]